MRWFNLKMKQAMKNITLSIALILMVLGAFAQKITRGPEIGEIYFLGPTATVMYDAIYRSTDFGETAFCVDSVSCLNNSIEAITADKTPGGLYYVTMGEALYYSGDYGQYGSWQLHSGGVSYRISSGRNEGEIFNTILAHSNDYGLNFSNHNLQGYFGSLKTFDICINDGIGFCITNSYEVIDTLYLFISFDNFNNLEVVNKFNFMDGEDVQLSRENNSGYLFLYNANRKRLLLSKDFGENWILKNLFTCPNLPVKGITGGRQDGELYLLVEYLQMMGQRRHVYIYHSLDYGETFTIYHPVSIGPDPIYANFIAIDTLVEPGDTVQFTDLSNDAETWEWDFNNDGIIDSYEKNPTHIYQDTGYYSVKLTITGEAVEDYGIRFDYIHVDNITGINGPILNNSEFITFPVPAKDVLNVQLNFEAAEIQLLDLSGKVVKTYNNSTTANASIELSVNDIPSGVYLLKVNSRQKTITKKILINK